MDFSVLMSVYYKEKPEYLRQALDSVLNQTVTPSQIVLVCDGALTEELEQVIAEYSDKIDVIRQEENKGLAAALNLGLENCKYELVGRMDTDDISLPDRFEKQLSMFEEFPQLDLLGSPVDEFSSSPDEILRSRVVPLDNEAIKKYGKRRCPFNHPTVMFRKSAVEKVGKYDESYTWVQDYNLWVRMLIDGAYSANLAEPVVRMRVTDDFYIRRGGKKYAKIILRLYREFSEMGWISKFEYILYSVPHVIICYMPSFVRRIAYKFLRKQRKQ